MNKRASLLACSVLLAASVVSAHHSVSAEFDTSTTVAFNGTICSVELSIPHSHMYVHVRLNNGQAETWKVTLAAPHLLTPAGLTRDSLKAGDSISIAANTSRTTSQPSPTPSLFYSACQDYLAHRLRSGYAREVTLSTGKQVRFSEEQPAIVTVIRQ